MKSIHYSSGFTAVELLITLFVAAAFLATGFQLYTSIIRSGGDSRQAALASNIAYTNLRALAATTPPCAGNTVTSYPLTGTTGLTNPIIIKSVSAPHGCPWENNVMLAQVTLQYGPSSNRQEISHALYVQR